MNPHLLLNVSVRCLDCCVCLANFTRFWNLLTHYLVRRNTVLSKLTGKMHFFVSQTYWIVREKSQQKTAFSDCAHGVMEFGTWVNLTPLGGQGTDGKVSGLEK